MDGIDLSSSHVIPFVFFRMMVDSLARGFEVWRFSRLGTSFPSLWKKKLSYLSEISSMFLFRMIMWLSCTFTEVESYDLVDYFPLFGDEDACDGISLPVDDMLLWVTKIDLGYVDPIWDAFDERFEGHLHGLALRRLIMGGLGWHLALLALPKAWVWWFLL